MDAWIARDAVLAACAAFLGGVLTLGIRAALDRLSMRDRRRAGSRAQAATPTPRVSTTSRFAEIERAGQHRLGAMAGSSWPTHQDDRLTGPPMPAPVLAPQPMRAPAPEPEPAPEEAPDPEPTPTPEPTPAPATEPEPQQESAAVLAPAPPTPPTLYIAATPTPVPAVESPEPEEKATQESEPEAPSSSAMDDDVPGPRTPADGDLGEGNGKLVSYPPAQPRPRPTHPASQIPEH
ncbi:MAG: hypothetical protein FWD59_03330 [Micrococcales bacterium]|nr:hypothetical protein [Micrococcales bacterium]